MNLLEKLNNRQSIYQLDFKVKFIKNGMTIKRLFEIDPMRLNTGFTLDEDISESIDKICISDAHTHEERLVFPAFWVINPEGKRILGFRCNSIAGESTMMIHGGDSGSIKEPEYYENYLRKLNK